MDKDTLEGLSAKLGVVRILVSDMKARVDDALIDREEALDRVTRDLREATAAVAEKLGEWDAETKQAILTVIANGEGEFNLAEIVVRCALSQSDAARFLRELVSEGKIVALPPDLNPKYDLGAFAGKHEAPEWPNVSAEVPTVHLRMLTAEVAASLRNVHDAAYRGSSVAAAEVGPASLAAALSSRLVGVNSGFLYLTPEGHQALIDHDKAVAGRDEAPTEEEPERNPGRDVRINDDEASILAALDEPKAMQALVNEPSLAGIRWSRLDRIRELRLLWIAGSEVIYRTSLGHQALRNYERAQSEVESRTFTAENVTYEEARGVSTPSILGTRGDASITVGGAHHGPGVRRYENYEVWEDDGDPS